MKECGQLAQGIAWSKRIIDSVLVGAEAKEEQI